MTSGLMTSGLMLASVFDASVWTALAAAAVAAAASILFLRTRDFFYDALALAVTEIGLLLLAVGSLGVFFGRLIQSAISRQREFLADAASVQFTRNPAGLSGALQKVGGYSSCVLSPHAPDAAHLFFGNVNGESFFDLMATHPPLEKRIRAIDPGWNGKFNRLPDEKKGSGLPPRNRAATSIGH